MKKIVSMRKWCLPDDADYLQKIENPPSLADGLSREMEMDLRYACCDFMQCCAILLKLPQRAACTAQILFHRYFTLKSFLRVESRYNYEHVLMACLLIASKVDDAPRKCRDVINVYFRLKQLKESPEPRFNKAQKFQRVRLNDQYVMLKQLLQKVERKILNVLGFVFHIDHPHKFVYAYLHYLGLAEHTALLQKSWSIHFANLISKCVDPNFLRNYMNDSFRSGVLLRFRSEAIASACVQLASANIDVPIVLPQHPAWFELFDVTLDEVSAISDDLMKSYGRTLIPHLTSLSAQLGKLNMNIVPLNLGKKEAIEKKAKTGFESMEVSVSIKNEPTEEMSQEELVNPTISSTVSETQSSVVSDRQIKKEFLYLNYEKEANRETCNNPCSAKLCEVNGEHIAVKREVVKESSQCYLAGNESLVQINSPLGISKVQFCPDTSASFLLASTWDGFVKVFNVADPMQVVDICTYSHNFPVLCCTFADASTVVTGVLDGLIKLYDVESGHGEVVGRHSDCVRCVEFSQPNRVVVSGGWDSIVKMWDCRLGTVQRGVGQLQCSDKVYALDVLNNLAVIGTKDLQVVTYDFRKTSVPLQTRPSPLQYQTRAVKIMPSFEAFAISSIEGRVAISYFSKDPNVQQSSYEFECHRIKNHGEECIYPVNAIAIHPWGTFATGGSDGRVSMWDPFGRKPLCQFRKLPTSVASLSFSPAGEVLAIATTYLFEDGNEPKELPKSRLILRKMAEIEARPRKN